VPSGVWIRLAGLLGASALIAAIVPRTWQLLLVLVLTVGTGWSLRYAYGRAAKPDMPTLARGMALVVLFELLTILPLVLLFGNRPGFAGIAATGLFLVLCLMQPHVSATPPD
jgi:hypothetical protein